MASAFGHAAAGVAIVSAFTARKPGVPAWFWLLAAVLAILPDADALGYKLGVPYGSVWGHRGFTHSIPFALMLSALLCWALGRWGDTLGLSAGWIFGCILCVVLSHAFLDAMTTGGMGVGFFCPFSARRYFFAFRPILVSPLGIVEFFSAYGLKVLASEAVWIGIPSAIVIAVSRLVSRV